MRALDRADVGALDDEGQPHGRRSLPSRAEPCGRLHVRPRRAERVEIAVGDVELGAHEALAARRQEHRQADGRGQLVAPRPAPATVRRLPQPGMGARQELAGVERDGVRGAAAREILVTRAVGRGFPAPHGIGTLHPRHTCFGALVDLTMLRTPAFGLLCVTLLSSAACAEIVVTGEADAAKDAAIVDSAPGGAGTDAAAGADTATVPDTAAIVEVAAPKSECETDFDCVNMKGKTPCKLPKCDKSGGGAVCKVVARLDGETCDNTLFDPPGECQVSQCDAVGTCKNLSKKEGALCGFGACGMKCAIGVCVPATPGDYDDGLPCTEDYCDQGKAVVHHPINKLVAGACDDGNKCTPSDYCIDGKCQGEQKACNDGLDCTLDTCFPDKGCVYTPDPKKCDDGNPCTKDGCDLAKGCTVTGNEVATCDDGNKCTQSDVCSGGVCLGKPNAECGCTTIADCAQYDKNPCQGKFKCADKKCVLDPATAPKCPTDKDSACSKSLCAPATGACALTPVADGKECTDQNKCTKAAACQKGQCVGSGAVSCDDKNDCTQDACDPDKECTHAPTTQPCDDKNKCTANDSCATGSCTGQKKQCDDGIACTLDGCDATTGSCTNVPDEKSCADGNPCTTNKCDVAAKGCSVTPQDGGTCDDNNTCTGPDKCASGKCAGPNSCQCTVDANCDDKNPCTKDTCDGGKCTSTAAVASGASCDTPDKCQEAGSGICMGSGCTWGNKPKKCGGDPCNTGTCNAATGACEKVTKGDGTPCDADQNPCTQGDSCKAGKCVVGSVVNCDSATEPCMIGKCQPSTTSASGFQCQKTPKTPATVCDDGQFCTEPSLCDATGKCKLGSPKLCPGYPNQPCTKGKCQEMTKQCVPESKLAGEPCDDGKYCSSGEVCTSTGECGGGVPTTCPLPKECQVNTCYEGADKCVLTLEPDCCVTSQDCFDGKWCTNDMCTDGQCTYQQKAGCNCGPWIWANNFTGGKLGQMTITNDAGPGLGWQALDPSPQSKSPSGAMYYGNPTTKNYDFLNLNPNPISLWKPKNSGTLSLPPIALPQVPKSDSGGNITFNFDVWMDVELGIAVGADDLSVLLVDATGQEHLLWTKTHGKTQSPTPAEIVKATWMFQSVALEQYMGQTVTIKFEFNTVDSNNNLTEGVYLDNLQLNAVCP
ncbi:MAG: hypothetical protein EXR79_05580 [Myxococcales bacterium]|nr:hypothetical protein [Myxococcales bacterium]